MKKGFKLVILSMFLGYLLTACGEDPTTTPPPQFVTSTPSRVVSVAAIPRGTSGAIAQATVALANQNPIIATITAASNAVNQTPLPPTPTVPPAPTATPLPIDIPAYSGAEEIDLGGYGMQIANGINQNSRGVRNAIYRTSDAFDKVATFYDSQMVSLGYTKTTQRPLPERVGLVGNVLIYTKGAGDSGTAVAIMALGPLDESLTQTLSQASTDAAKLKSGDTLLIVLSGLNKTLTSDLENSLKEPPTVKP